MRKRSYLLCFLMIFSVLGSMFSCDSPKMTSDNVYFEYSLIEGKSAYRISDSNIAWVSTADNWEMVDVVIPSEYKGLPVTEIGFEAFRNSQILRSVAIPDSITDIKANAFFDCNNLESIFIPKSVESIAGEPFRSCNSLKTITVDSDNPSYCSIDGVVFTKDQSELVFYPPGKEQAAFEIPEGVLAVHRYAFAHCENIARIVVPATVTDLPYDAILFCERLSGVVVDENNLIYQSIDGNLYSKDGATFLRFYRADENGSLVIPRGVSVIAQFACYYSDHLVSITIPNTVTFIGDSAFERCDDLKNAVFEDTTGWKVVPCNGSKFESTKSLDGDSMRSPTTNAQYLVETYTDYEWNLEK